jgi:hypothetical protein
LFSAEKQEILNAIEKGNTEFLKMKIAQGYSNVDGFVTKGEFLFVLRI